MAQDNRSTQGRLFGWLRRDKTVDAPSTPSTASTAELPLVGIKACREHLDGEAGIRQLGHREHIGGRWDEMGQLQFDFLLSQGLEPRHYYLDIACGSLRGGVHFIPYLEPGHYLGIEKEALLVEMGIREELGAELADAKRPEIVISSTFEFNKLSARPDFALAQSLFSHIPIEAIELCLTNLRPILAEDGVLFVTFNEVDQPVPNPEAAHDWGHFQYRQSDMRAVAERCGWDFHYVGDWGHARGQRMLRLTIPR